MHAEHERDLSDFGVSYDRYSTTHSDANREIVNGIYEKLEAKGLIDVRPVEQFFDEERGMFLPDRFVKGRCPKCDSEDQYGDSCEVCGSTYEPTDLKDPRSIVTGSTPVRRASEHYFVQLGKLESLLREWTGSGRLQSEVVNKLEEWFADGLRDWDVSRDAPYFGFKIPGTDDKYFYVWVDAPVGYMASFREFCDQEGIDFDAFWAPDSTADVYHIIGKDIVYFHTLFWPALLHAGGYRLPSGVFVHGFLTVNGEKMSKSRGTFIQARTYLDHLAPDYLRYYFASKLGSGLSDIDLNLEDFVARVNADLVGKVVNIASRCAGFIQKRFDGKLAPALPEPEMFARFAEAGDAIAEHFTAREYNRAIRGIMALADEANRYIDEKKPWKLIKEPGSEADVQAVCTQGINLFRQLAIYLKPVIPETVGRAEAFLGGTSLVWSDARKPLLDVAINPFQPLLTRIEEAHVKAIVEASRQDLEKLQAAESKGAASRPSSDVAPIAEEIEFPTFAEVDLRIARIVEADHVEGADKLLRLKLDIGSESRQVFAGIKAAYDPSELVGRLTVMVANLKPRKMRFGMSEGMVLAAGPGGDELFLLTPDEGAQAGMRVK